MKTLHNEDFVEFKVLPWLIAFFAILFVVSAVINSRKWLYTSFGLFVVFGVVAMVDFWRWEYNYGHNLDPNAAIVVPGMAYQPPLIGFKQLLNFGAYSMPDLGGWLFIAAGALLLLAVIIEARRGKSKTRVPVMLMVGCCTLLLSSCGTTGPEPVLLNQDACAYCKMRIADGRLAAELSTNKGRIYKFDDLHCLFAFESEGEPGMTKHYYVSDFTGSNSLFDASNGWYVKSNTVKSAMGGNTAAFTTQEAALDFAKKNNDTVLRWADLRNSFANASTHEQ